MEIFNCLFRFFLCKKPEQKYLKKSISMESISLESTSSTASTVDLQVRY